MYLKIEARGETSSEYVYWIFEISKPQCVEFPQFRDLDALRFQSFKLDESNS